jgi:hypothetical protein
MINLIKTIKWNPDKNKQLMAERGISFEAVVIAMQSGHLIDSYPHPKLTHQKIVEVEVEGYVVVVPYIEEIDYLFFKTAFHSRKATKQNLKGKTK